MAFTSQSKQNMFAIFLLLVLGISQVMSRKLHETSLRERHEQWMTRYGKVYEDAAEKEKRFQIFKDNVEFIESSNAAGNKPYQLGVNHFADLTLEEFKASRNGLKGPREFSTTPFKYENVRAIPQAVDWREEGAVTPVKDQGQCGKINKIIQSVLHYLHCSTIIIISSILFHLYFLKFSITIML